MSDIGDFIDPDSLPGLIFLVLLLLAAPGLLALRRVGRLGRELGQLRAELAALRRGESVAVAPAPAVPLPAAPSTAPPAAGEAPEIAPAAPAPTSPETVPAAAPAAPVDVEKRLTGRWTVWLGAVALALGGVFLVKYSIEQELIGPAVRVALGLLLGATLIGLAGLARRSAFAMSSSAGVGRFAQPDYVAPALAAAGVATRLGKNRFPPVRSRIRSRPTPW